MATILLIDDDLGNHHILRRIGSKMGHEVFTAVNLASGYSLAEQVLPDVIFLDVMLPDGIGLDSISKLKALPCAPEIIVMTAFADAGGAEQALSLGAWEYTQKGMSLDAIRLLLERALAHKNRASAAVATTPSDLIVGTSWALRHALGLALDYAQTENNVLIMGETGTGKELFARYIHAHSARKAKPFVVVDCAAIVEDLAGSILFGHAKGAFTHAVASHKGLFAEAEGGTLFLDELGELPLHLQKIFLRVLQERAYRPVGGTKEENCNVRIIAATNKDVARMVEEKQFRSDLFYRIQTCQLLLPSLANREKDVELLAQNFLDALCDENAVPKKQFAPECLQVLTNHEWHGNVRELKNIVSHIFSCATKETTVYPQHLPTAMRIAYARKIFALPNDFCLGHAQEEQHAGDSASNARELSLPSKMTEPFSTAWDGSKTLAEFRESALEALEKQYLCALLQKPNINFAECLRISGLSRSRFYGILKKYGLQSPNN